MTRNLAPWLLAAPLALLIGCQPSPAPESPATPAAKAALKNMADKDSAKPAATAKALPAGCRIAVVPKAISQQFWTTVRAGAEAAGKEAGVEIIWKGPDVETDTTGQKAIIEDFVTQKVNAIVMAATSADALVPTIQKAEEGGVPVVTIDSGVNWDGVRSLVATDNVAGAKKGGEKLVELIGGEGKVGSIPFVKGAASSEDREKGFADAIAATGGKVTIVKTLYSNSSIDGGKSVAADMMTAEPDLKGIFGANESGAVGAANAIKAAGKVGKIILVGFDGSPQEVQFLRDGVIQALVLQDPYNMGYKGVGQALKAIRGEPNDKVVDTGVFVLTKENIDSPEARKLLQESGALEAPKQ
jgi:ribose transport system substrate-binding protein